MYYNVINVFEFFKFSYKKVKKFIDYEIVKMFLLIFNFNI